MINLYHRGFLPDNVDVNMLNRWEFVYLHGEIEAPEFKVDAPDIFWSDTPLDRLNDGIFECQLHMNAKITKVEAFIWSVADRVRFISGQYIVDGRRHGLVVSSDNIEDWTHAYTNYSKQSITA